MMKVIINYFKGYEAQILSKGAESFSYMVISVANIVSLV